MPYHVFINNYKGVLWQFRRLNFSYTAHHYNSTCLNKRWFNLKYCLFNEFYGRSDAAFVINDATTTYNYLRVVILSNKYNKTRKLYVIVNDKVLYHILLLIFNNKRKYYLSILIDKRKDDIK